VKGFNQYLESQKDVQSIISGIEGNLKEQLVAGLSGSARSMLVSALEAATKRPILLVTYQLVQAQQLYDDLTVLVDEDRVHLYPVNELIASDIAISSPELKSQ